ncbi:hypothetical protein SM033_00162 [Vibrio phage vB_VpaM_sm033]|nr:hypothetical protein SM033_00162 [Vibrio phage vB_VpaM_sm033]
MYVTESTKTTDSRWVKQAFFRRPSADQVKRKFYIGGAGSNSTDMSQTLNFYDTTLGGNRSINPKPQFCRFSDPKINTVSKTCKSMGMGYKEAVDDNAQRISLQFGIPKHNSMTAFLANYYDADMGALVKYGTASPVLYKLGRTIGALFTLPLQTFYGINYLYNRIASTMSGNPYSKYYYLNPAMPLYWNSVSMIFNKIMVDMGLTDSYTGYDTNGKENVGDVELSGNLLDSGFMERISQLIPDVLRSGFSDGYHLDVKSIASRSQRMANEFNEYVTSLEEREANSSREEGIFNIQSALQEVARNQSLVEPAPRFGGRKYIDDFYSNSTMGKGEEAVQNDLLREEGDTGQPVASSVPNQENPTGEEDRSIFSKFEDFAKYARADLQEGSAFVTFEVDKTGPISHSFTNSTKEAPMKETVNGAADAAKNLNYTFFGGNIGDNIALDAIESAVSGVKNLLTGVVDQVGITGLTTGLAAGAKMSMTDVYDDSSAELNGTQYSLTLATPYGNRYSILTRVYLPLCCLLAGVLPRQTGKNSYDSPFLVRLHSQGFEEIKLGIISNLNLEIGSSNIGRSVDGLPTAIKVTFTVENLDKDISMPLSDSVAKEALTFSAFDEDTTFSDFLTSLSGLDLTNQYFMGKRLKRAWRKSLATWNTIYSPAYFSQWFAGTMPGKTLSSIMKYGDL